MCFGEKEHTDSSDNLYIPLQPDKREVHFLTEKGIYYKRLEKPVGSGDLENKTISASAIKYHWSIIKTKIAVGSQDGTRSREKSHMRNT
jgi:hypothetical protein